MDTLIDLFSSFNIQNGRLPTASERRSIISNAAFQDPRCYEAERVSSKVKALKRKCKELHKRRRHLSPSQSRLYERLNKVWPA
jgi:hypothetical protein